MQPRAQRGQVVVSELLAKAGVDQVHQAVLVQAVQAAHSQHPLYVLEQGPGPWGCDRREGVSLDQELSPILSFVWVVWWGSRQDGGWWNDYPRWEISLVKCVLWSA